MSDDMIPVVIATEGRAVLGGFMDAAVYKDCQRNGIRGRTIELHQTRMCVRWTKAEKGVLGLAEEGPGSGCRISPARSIPDLHMPVYIGMMTQRALAKWESEPWAP